MEHCLNISNRIEMVIEAVLLRATLQQQLNWIIKYHTKKSYDELRKLTEHMTVDIVFKRFTFVGPLRLCAIVIHCGRSE